MEANRHREFIQYIREIVEPLTEQHIAGLDLDDGTRFVQPNFERGNFQFAQFPLIPYNAIALETLIDGINQDVEDKPEKGIPRSILAEIVYHYNHNRNRPRYQIVIAPLKGLAPHNWSEDTQKMLHHFSRAIKDYGQKHKHD